VRSGRPLRPLSGPDMNGHPFGRETASTGRWKGIWRRRRGPGLKRDAEQTANNNNHFAPVALAA